MKEKRKEVDFNEGNFRDILMKKALGYDCTETVEEYVSENGEIKLTKKKVTKKNVPPDISALKLLIEDKGRSVSSMSDEELEEEKERLMKLLKRKSTKKKGEEN